MNRESWLLVWCCWSCAIMLPSAESPRITSENANQVRLLTETPKLANRILLGPGPTELTIFGDSTPLEIVDDTDFRTLRNIKEKFVPIDFAWSPDRKFLTWTEQNSKSYFLLEVLTGKTTEIDIGDYPGDAAFSPDSKRLAIGKTFWDPNAPGTGLSEVVLVDMTGKLIHTIEVGQPGGLRPVFSPDGKTLAVGNRNSSTNLYEVETGKRLATLTKHQTQEIAFSPDGKTLAVGYVDGNIALWSVPDGKLLQMSASECKEIYSVSWNPKGDVLATCGLEGKIVLWNAEKLTKLATFDAPIWVIQARFSADGTRLLTASSSQPTAKEDRQIRTYGIPSVE